MRGGGAVSPPAGPSTKTEVTQTGHRRQRLTQSEPTVGDQARLPILMRSETKHKDWTENMVVPALGSSQWPFSAVVKTRGQVLPSGDYGAEIEPAS